MHEPQEQSQAEVFNHFADANNNIFLSVFEKIS